MKILIDSFYGSFNFLSEAFGLVLLITVYFGLGGLHLFRGLYKYRCMERVSGIINLDSVCGAYTQCSIESMCVKMQDNVNLSDSYDNFFFSFANSLRTMAMDKWSDVMVRMISCFNPICVIYYILGIFIGGLFTLNIIIAVLKMHYAVQEEKFENEINEEVISRYSALEISLIKLRESCFSKMLPIL